MTMYAILALWALCLACQLSYAAKEVWYVEAPANSDNFKELLAPFTPVQRAWGRDSLAFSDKHGDSLAVHYRKGSYSKTKHKGGAFYATPTQLKKDADDLILEYDVFFENFGWGNMGKLPGLYGGDDGKGAYACSGGNNPSTCFSLRLAWRKDGGSEVYGYISESQLDGFASRDDIITNYPYGASIGRAKVHFRTEEWQTVREEVHLNSDPSKADGWIKLCVFYKDKSEECYTTDKLVIRKSNDHHFRGFVFSSFFGGSRPRDAAPNNCSTYYKNFRLLYPSSDDTIIG